jgi:hypothetical protein
MMSYLKLMMTEGNKNVELEIENSDEKQRNDTVMGLFRFFGDKEAISIPAIMITASKEKADPAPLPTLSAGGTTTTPELYKPAKPPLMHSERTLQMPIGEITGSASTDEGSTVPEHYKTGIKYKDGIPHYRMRYWCKNQKCRDKGTDYILPDEMIANCRTCGTAHKVRPAAPKGERDNYGNFFIADALAEGAMG